MDRRRNPLRDLAPFRAWLEAQPSSRTVGVPGKGTSCPLANYVREARSAEFVAIPDCMGYVVDEQYFAVPPWAREFIKKVDAEKRPEIWAGRALTLLAEVEAGGS